MKTARAAFAFSRAGAIAALAPNSAIADRKCAKRHSAIALVNRYVLAPRLKPDAPAPRVLTNTSIAEVVLGVAVVALASVFGLLDPF